jgi:hypothetical protein
MSFGLQKIYCSSKKTKYRTGNNGRNTIDKHYNFTYRVGMMAKGLFADDFNQHSFCYFFSQQHAIQNGMFFELVSWHIQVTEGLF